ncbi:MULTISPECIES: hypothetical protein [Acaryochloris]|nr:MULTISPECIES: hypothetical protein [Acaryochloris]
MAVSEAPSLEAGRSKTIAYNTCQRVGDQIHHQSRYQAHPVIHTR